MKASPHRPTKALIHLRAIRQNIQQMGAHIPQGTLKWAVVKALSLIHISDPTRLHKVSRMTSSA